LRHTKCLPHQMPPMPELPPDPANLRDSQSGQSGDDTRNISVVPASSRAVQPLKLSTGRYGDLEAHEIIHLLDALDEESARARFRESVYLSTLFCFAIAWFIFYGPRVLFHQPQYRDPIAAMKERDRQISLNVPPPLVHHPPARSVPDRKTMQQLQQQPRTTPVAPSEPQPQPQPTPPPQEQAHTAAPPVAQPALPLPSAPRPAQQPLVDAPAPSPRIAQNSSNSMQDLLRGARSQSAPNLSAPHSAGPLQSGADILSDTMGVDFTSYMNRLTHDVRRNWEPLIPEEVQAPLMKKGIVGIRFSILPDGKIGAMTLETRSGDVALDKAAWGSITSEGNFPPLPKEFHGPQLELRIGYYYNLQPPQ